MAIVNCIYAFRGGPAPLFHAPLWDIGLGKAFGYPIAICPDAPRILTVSSLEGEVILKNRRGARGKSE